MVGSAERHTGRYTRAWAFDCEWSILPGTEGELVTVQAQWIDLTGPEPRLAGPPEVYLARDPETRERVRVVVVDPSVYIVGHGTHNDTHAVARAFNLWEEVEAAYEAARVGCTMIRARLRDIARPGSLIEVDASRIKGLADDERDAADPDDPDADELEEADEVHTRGRAKTYRVVRKRAGQYGTGAPLFIPKRGLPIDMASILRRSFGIEAGADKVAAIPPSKYRQALAAVFGEDWADVEARPGTPEEAETGWSVWSLLEAGGSRPVRRRDGTASVRAIKPGRDALRAAAASAARSKSSRARPSKPGPAELVAVLAEQEDRDAWAAYQARRGELGPLFAAAADAEHGEVVERVGRLRRLVGTREGLVRCACAALHAAKPWRFRYGELLDTPIEDFPEDARRYAAEDGVHTAQIWISQGKRPTDPWAFPNVRWWDRLTGPGPFQYAHEAERAHFAYHLEASLAPGLRVDRERARRTYDAYVRVRDAAGRVLVRHGVARERGSAELVEGGTREAVADEALRTQALAAYADPAAPPPGLTPKGLERYPHLEGLPLQEWPADAWPYLSCAGYQLKRVCGAPKGSDADELLRLGAPGLVAAGWDPDRIEAALEQCAFPALAARGLAAKAHSYGRGQVWRLVANERGYTRSRASILANTGRISISGDLGQNTPREGGIRECIVPRPGNVFLDVDYSQIELVAFAMLIDLAEGRPIGTGPLSSVLNAQRDAHLILAGDLLVYQGIGVSRTEPYDYETLLALKAGALEPAIAAILADRGLDPRGPVPADVLGIAEAAIRLGPPIFKAAKNARQDAKPVNYGQGANMSDATFARTQAKVGHPITIEEARRGKVAFWSRWKPDAYFAAIARLQSEAAALGVGVNLLVGPPTLSGQIARPRDSLVRGGLTYTETANTFFQTIVALGFARAYIRLCQAGRDRRSPLFGFHPRLPVHDQVLTEGPAERAAEALGEQQRIMVEAMSEVLPSMYVGTSGETRAEWGK